MAPSTTNLLPIRHELTQCQQCWVSKGPNVTFSRCSGCKIEIYCSKSCQKAAWPTHKTKCKLNSRLSGQTGLGAYEAKLKTLRTFTSKHRPTLCECGVRALELGLDANNAKTKFLYVGVRERRHAMKAELAYIVEEVEVVPYASLEPLVAAEMQSVRETMDQINVEQGLDDTFFVMLHDLDSGVRNNAPVGFAKETTYNKSMSYRDMLFRYLNNGITV